MASENGNNPQFCSTSSEAHRSSNHEPKHTVGNPINFITGNKFHRETYFSAAQPDGIIFQRFYNSSDAIWRHSYSDKLTFQTSQIILSLADGKKLYFLPNGAPKDSATAIHGKLSTQDSGWKFLAKNNTNYLFNMQGHLIAIISPSGSTQSLSYITTATSTQVFVEDVFGNQINFKQNSAGSLYALTATGMTMSFTHNAHGQLIKSTKTLNSQKIVRQYHYEDPNNLLNLTGITDERGVRYATWAYDIQGRAISSQHTGGVDKVLISYDSNLSTTVTNELGKKTTYRFSIIDGSKRITAVEGQPSANCPDSNSTFTYDNRGLLKTKLDNKGNLTAYDYNDRGLEVSRTEASGTAQARTISTEWHPTLFLPLVVSEPDRITRYQYDDQGRQLNRTVEAR